MPRTQAGLWLALACGLAAQPLTAQDADRIWGRVTTVSGDVHEGFIRWDRNEGSWADILDGSKDVAPEVYERWIEFTKSGERPVRTLDVKGYRVSWNEDDPDFPMLSPSGIRFGHISSLSVVGEDEAELLLKSGERLILSGGSTDIGRSIRDVIVEPRRGDAIELDWPDIDEVTFAAVPAGVRAASPRLYGTVEDQLGNRFTGYISWDLDEIFGSDILDGDDPDGDSRRIAFSEIRSIEGGRRASTVTLKNGDVLELDDSNDVDRGNRGVQISDPTLGMIEVEWEEFSRIDLTPAPEPYAYEAFDGGHRLTGTVTTQTGESYAGLIRWDADEEWSWEFLDGRWEDVKFTVEFSNIAHIARAEVFGAEVTLTDGRMLELEDRSDVDWDNRGVFIFPYPEGPEAMTATVQYVPWEDFAEVTFEHRDRRETTGGGR
ncbi:MAG: hypothetical protein HKN73_06365 [Gemmatimonadetes bacterium]|nr:hypothetical protein [Gemmatimonadota bacterium]